MTMKLFLKSLVVPHMENLMVQHQSLTKAQIQRRQEFKIKQLDGIVIINQEKGLMLLVVELKALGQQTQHNGIMVILIYCLNMNTN